MIRIVALIAGLLLFVFPGLWLLDFIGISKYRLFVSPGLWLLDLSGIVSKYRKLSSADFLFLGQTLFPIYGSVLFGAAVYWVRANRSGRPFLPSKVFIAGMLGMLAACTAFFVGSGVYGHLKYGAVEKGIGNLWGLLVIFWVVLSTLVSAGLALLFYAWRGPAAPSGPAPRTGPWSAPPT
jgi:hypothetical protein